GGSGGIGKGGSDPGGNGGAGAIGRIRIEYCDSASGITNPVASIQQITCIPPNEPPIAVAGTSLDQNGKLQLNGSLSNDPNEGDTLSFSWQISGQADPLIGQFASIAGLASGDYNVVLTVTDNNGASDSDVLSLGIPFTNQAPVVSVGEDNTVTRGSTFNLDAVFSDPDTSDTHNAIIYWGDGSKESGTINGAVVSGSHVYNFLGTYLVIVCVSDSHGLGCDDLVLQVVGGTPSNRGGPPQ
ncbi:MAG: PKD domain-containing protein, partial [Patescibacteria group bacterium]